MERIVIAALALLALEYIALGGWLGRVWGINPSRSTPYAERTGKKRGGALTLLGGYVLCSLWPALMACAPLLHAAQGAAAYLPLAVAALLGGLLSMLTLFVSIRHGARRLPDVAGETHGAWLGRTMHALAALSMIACAGAMIAMLPALLRGAMRVQEMPEQMAAYALLMLCALHACIPDAALARRVRSERHIRRIGLGGVLLGCALPAVLALPGVCAAASEWLKDVDAYIQAALCAASALLATYLACGSAKGLFARRVLFARRKPKAALFAPVGTILLIALSVRAGCGYLMLFGGAVGFVYAMLALIVCALWLISVGRGLLIGRK